VKHDSNTSDITEVTPFDDNYDCDMSSIFTLVRLYHHHKATPEFQRHISYVIAMLSVANNNTQLQPMYIIMLMLVVLSLISQISILTQLKYQMKLRTSLSQSTGFFLLIPSVRPESFTE
jgi:hypothetical protein